MKIINKVANGLVVLITFLMFSCNANDKNGLLVPEDWFYNSGIDSASEFKDYFDELKVEISSNLKSKVAKKISYPITIKMAEDKALSIKNEAEFVENYSLIINKTVVDAISKQEFNAIRKYSNGVMIGRGVLWISSIKLNESDEYQIKIFAINN
jgi:hypothetical protein